jgi:hypothetical protein
MPFVGRYTPWVCDPSLQAPPSCKQQPQSKTSRACGTYLPSAAIVPVTQQQQSAGHTSKQTAAEGHGGGRSQVQALLLGRSAPWRRAESRAAGERNERRFGRCTACSNAALHFSLLCCASYLVCKLRSALVWLPIAPIKRAARSRLPAAASARSALDRREANCLRPLCAARQPERPSKRAIWRQWIWRRTKTLTAPSSSCCNASP